MMVEHERQPDYLLCISNEKYPVSLELHKVYRAVLDATAESDGFVRVIDESGEDYLFPRRLFVAIDLPPAARRAFAQAS